MEIVRLLTIVTSDKRNNRTEKLLLFKQIWRKTYLEIANTT